MYRIGHVNFMFFSQRWVANVKALSGEIWAIHVVKMIPRPMRRSEDRAGPLVTCTGNPYKSTDTSSQVSTGDLPGLPVQVINDPDRSSGFLIASILLAFCTLFFSEHR